MAKFAALVRNENLKLRRRKTLWVMLILILVASFGFSAIAGGISTLVNLLFDTEPFETYCDEEIRYYQEIVSSGEDGDRHAASQVLLYTTLKEIGADWDDWRYTSDITEQYVHCVAEGDEETAEALKAILYTNDYRAYYAMLIAENEAIYGSSAIADAANEGLRYCLEQGIEPSRDDWKYNTAMQMGEYALRVKQYEQLSKQDATAYRDALEAARDGYALAKYRLEHHIRVNPASAFRASADDLDEATEETSRFWTLARAGVGTVSIVGLFSIILGAGMIASEFGKGTVKFLLITPVSRWKIVLAKYCSLLLNTGLFLLVLMVANILFAVIFCGGRDLFLPALSVSGGVVHRSSPILTLIGYYLLEMVGVTVTATLAFAISSLFRNSAAAVGVSMLVLYGGNLFNTILAAAGADWGRYLIFANLNLSSIRSGPTYYPHQSVGVAVVILVLHMAVFLLTAFDAFDRKEI